METTSFVLGILSVVGMIMIVLAVYSFVKINTLNTKIQELETGINMHLDSLNRQLDNYSELDNRRIDGEITRTDSMITDLYKYTDSRLDKLENKLIDLLKSADKSNSKVKEIIKG